MRPTFDEAKERAEQRGDEWQFGAIKTDLALVPLSQRMLYTPVGVIQRNNIMDTFGCASRSPVAILNSKFTYYYHNGMHPELKRWLFENGYVKDGRVVFDETFIEILSGTAPNGNSLKAPLEAIRKYGLIPEMLPLEDDMTWEQYMDESRITEAMYELGREFKKRFTINYEQVHVREFLHALDEDHLDVAGHGWPKPVNGVYPRTSNPYNHAFDAATPLIDAIDSYPPFTKRLAPDYSFFDWGYSLSVTSVNAYPEDTISLYKQIIQLATYLLSLLTKKSVSPTAPTKPVEPPTVPPAPDKRQDVYDAAKKAIGQDLSKHAPDERGCAESLSRVLRMVYPDFPIKLSTIQLQELFDTDIRFKETAHPSPGCISIFATRGTKIGHCGVWGRTHCMSNDSRTGEWSANYLHEEWYLAAQRRGLQLSFYIPL